MRAERRRVRHFLRYIFLIAAAAVVLFPIYAALVVAVGGPTDGFFEQERSEDLRDHVVIRTHEFRPCRGGFRR